MRWLAILAIWAVVSLTPLPILAAPRSVEAVPRAERTLPRGAVSRIGTLRFRHADTVVSVCFLTERTLLTASRDGTARIWDSSGTMLQSFKGCMGVPAVPTPDGAGVFTQRQDGVWCEWDVLSGVVRQEYQGQYPKMQEVGTDATGNIVAACTETGQMVVWDLSRRRRLEEIRLPVPRDESVRGFSLSPDGTSVVFAVIIPGSPSWHSLHLYRRKEQTTTKFSEGEGIISCVAHSPDGKQVAVVERTQFVRVWDLGPGSAHLIFRQEA